MSLIFGFIVGILVGAFIQIIPDLINYARKHLNDFKEDI
jgi:hypothetical protein